MLQKFFTTVLFLLIINLINAQDSISEKPDIQGSDTLFSVRKESVRENFIQKVLRGNLDWSFVATPFVDYQPETNWGFGIAGAYYIKPRKTGGKTGTLNFTATYTLKNQFSFKVTSIAYLDKKQRFMLYSSAAFNHYPDNFYGVGNRNENLADKVIAYNSDNVVLNVQPQTYIKGNWLLGINTHFRWEKAGADSINFEQIPKQKYNVFGFDEYFMLGFGGVIAYDSRNNLFYPDKGLFFKSILTYYEKIGKKSYRMGKIQTDFRHFIPIYKELIFAYQISTEWTFAAAKPFQMLSTIGGSELLRGIRTGFWRDDIMAVAQAELRIPIWNIFKAAVFCGIGDVYSLNDIKNIGNSHFSKPKIGYGIGLRVKFNKSKANLRLDLARQNFGNNFSWYITVNEAF
jgi:hypothetical protein